MRGRRDSFSDDWRWELYREDARARRLPARSLLLLVLCFASIAGAVGLFFLVNGEGEGGSSAGTATPSSPPATPREQTVTATTPASGVSLYAWSTGTQRWSEGELPAESGARESQSIPILLTIEGVRQGDSYDLSVAYQCSVDGVAAIDFLTSPGAGDSGALQAPPAPARPADSIAPIPDDPSITFDNISDSRFWLWGGTFQALPTGPLPPAGCDGEKSFELTVKAATERLDLVWGLHLASAADWGEGKGASSLGGPIVTGVTITGTGQASLVIAEGAVEP